MAKYNVEDVFKTTGVPELTYVEPQEYKSLLVAIRSKGKCVVVEGPSGIGKTTSIYKILSELGIDSNGIMFSARKILDIEKIKEISTGDFDGIVIVDDFHRLDSKLKERISDTMKILADNQDETRKIIVVGINRVGDTLVKFSPDLNNRISTIRFETNSDSKIKEMIKKGESALNIEFDDTTLLVENSSGSFHIAQLMCQKACIQEDVLESKEELTKIHFSYPIVSSKMNEEFSRSFFDVVREFAIGNKLRREGRAPYLHILKWLSESRDWSVDLSMEIHKHPAQKAGVTQIITKGYLSSFLRKHEKCSDYIHFDEISRLLSVEDPKFMFYIRSINWNNFAKDIGYIQVIEEPKYDFALSFAGSERDVAEKIFYRLQSREISVFYDYNEQHEILAENIEEYLYPIYNSEACFVVPFLSSNYPNRVWTRFESKVFKERFGQNAVIPIWFDNVDDSTFDCSKEFGGITFNTTAEIESEVERIVELLARKIEDYRTKHTGD